MANWSGFSFGGFDPVMSYFAELPFANEVSAQNYGWNAKMARFNQQLQKELADYQYGLSVQALKDAPAAQRQGLESAGYNPILAVNSAGGQSFSTSIPSVSSGGVSPPRLDLVTKAGDLELLQRSAQVKQTNAQTDFIRKRTQGEGWQIRTLTASEARGLGANLLGKLGFHFNGSDSQTFLVAYNPITNEIRNLAHAANGSLTTSGEPTNALEVLDAPPGEVEVSEPELVYPHRASQAFPKGRKHN